MIRCLLLDMEGHGSVEDSGEEKKRGLGIRTNLREEEAYGIIHRVRDSTDYAV